VTRSTAQLAGRCLFTAGPCIQTWKLNIKFMAEEGSQRHQTIKYGHAPRGARNQDHCTGEDQQQFTRDRLAMEQNFLRTLSGFLLLIIILLLLFTHRSPPQELWPDHAAH
jgi:hypothetical protein